MLNFSSLMMTHNRKNPFGFLLCLKANEFPRFGYCDYVLFFVCMRVDKLGIDLRDWRNIDGDVGGGGGGGRR